MARSISGAEHGLTLRKLNTVRMLSVPATAGAEEPRIIQTGKPIMVNHEPATVTRDKPRVRRSIWLTVMFSVFAIVVLEMAFPQSTLTAPIPDTVEMADMT